MFRLIAVLGVLAVLSISACAPISGQTIRVDGPSEFAQSPLREYKRLMYDLGYEHLGLVEPKIGHIVPVVQQHGEYRMLFTTADDTGLRVSVHLNVDDGDGKFNLHREDDKELTTGDLEHYRVLVERLTQRFGKDNVHAK